MSNNNFNFENAKNAMFNAMKSAFASNFSLKNVDECINSVEAATDKFNDFLGEVNDKAEELETAKADCSKAQEIFSQKKENLNSIDKWIKDAPVTPEEQEELRNTLLKKAEDEFAEAENTLTEAETKVRNLEKFFSDLKPIEQVVANKVETPKVETVKVETPKQKKSDAIVTDAIIRKIDKDFKVFVDNGKELDCLIYQDVKSILETLEKNKGYVFDRSFTVKYSKNNQKNAEHEFFLFFAKPNHC